MSELPKKVAPAIQSWQGARIHATTSALGGAAAIRAPYGLLFRYNSAVATPTVRVVQLTKVRDASPSLLPYNVCRCAAALTPQFEDQANRRSSSKRIRSESAERQRPKHGKTPAKAAGHQRLVMWLETLVVHSPATDVATKNLLS
jgi:hypothetical protein